jgi:hypothetical protein
MNNFTLMFFFPQRPDTLQVTESSRWARWGEIGPRYLSKIIKEQP